MSLQPERASAGSILTGNVDTIELTPADYSIVTSVGGTFSGPQGRWALFTSPEDGSALTRTGIFVCEPHSISTRLESDELMYMLEGEVRLELDDGSVAEIGPGDVAILPKNHQLNLTFKTPCKELFVTVR